LTALLGSLPDVEVVAVAADGFGAVKEVVLQRPDVAILDLQMPGQDGFAATRELRQGREQQARQWDQDLNLRRAESIRRIQEGFFLQRPQMSPYIIQASTLRERSVTTNTDCRIGAFGRLDCMSTSY
jgi:CheY-like chemotaxis protein